MARQCELDPLAFGGWHGLLTLESHPLKEGLDVASLEPLLLAPPSGLAKSDNLSPCLEITKPTLKAKPIVWTVERFCLTCGLSSSDWPSGGVSRNGKTYCCEGCADDSGCVCRHKSERAKTK